jgi:hypothetical protein
MSTQKNNDFQFLDVGRVDPAKKDLDQRKGEFTEIYHQFSNKMRDHKRTDALRVVIHIVHGNVLCTTISRIGSN